MHRLLGTLLLLATPLLGQTNIVAPATQTGTTPTFNSLVTAAQINYIYFVDGPRITPVTTSVHYTTIQSAIDNCLSDAAAAYEANLTYSCVIDARGALLESEQTFGGYDPTVSCTNGLGTPPCYAYCSTASAAPNCLPGKTTPITCDPVTQNFCIPVPIDVKFPASPNISETDTVTLERNSVYEADSGAGGGGVGATIECDGGPMYSDPCFSINQHEDTQAVDTAIRHLQFLGHSGNYGNSVLQNGLNITCSQVANQGMLEHQEDNVFWGDHSNSTAFTNNAINLDCEVPSIDPPYPASAGIEQLTFNHVYAFRNQGSSTNPLGSATPTGSALAIIGDVGLVAFNQGELVDVTVQDGSNIPTVYIGSAKPGQEGVASQYLECPANFVPGGMRQTGMRGA